MKILIDSSVWIEYFSGGEKAKSLEKYFKSPYKNILSSVVAYEVYKKIKATQGERMAILILAQMESLSTALVSADQAIAVRAADISLQHQIPMADALVYATSLISGSSLVTIDKHFKDLPNVQYIEKK